jgi:NAD(P)-dependent dehydrogenase (short-subunit alcohol dehydrogenase family)
LLQKHIVITGASSGLGLASARALAAQGAKLTLLARTESKLLSAAESIRAEFPDAVISEQVLDVSNLDQVRSFAQGLSEPVDVLMNNAGVMGPDFSLSIEGIESQMATNHIGHFLLTALLWPNLNLAKDARVISLSSVVHRRGKIKSASMDEIRGANKSSYDRWQRYADTKLACLYFARELDLRAKITGSNVRSVAAHPGWARTGLQKTNPTPFDKLAQSADEGAKSQILAALDPTIVGGAFLGPKYELWGEPKVISGSSRSKDLEIAKALWQTSEELTGVRFLV